VGVRKTELSGKLSKYVAELMGYADTDFFGLKKISFITRPLAKMGELFKSENRDELSIGFDNNREIQLYEESIKWLTECKNSCTGDDDNSVNLCKIQKCIGDMNFLYHFVLDAFAPKWGYTGKRVSDLIKGGNMAVKYNIKELLTLSKILNIQYTGSNKNLLIKKILKINLNTLSVPQIKQYCKFFYMKGYSKYKTKATLVAFINNVQHIATK
jgi:hypothetical protein